MDAPEDASDDGRESDAPAGELRALGLALLAHLERHGAPGQRSPRPGAASAAPTTAVPAPAPAARTAPAARAPSTSPPSRSAPALFAGPPVVISAEPGGAAGTAPPTLALARACADLDALRATVAACTACRLHATRTQTVFMDGPPRARVMFIGEAPGQSEDEQGVPFVGAAGQLLTDIITKGMGLKRSEVVIANVLKCRPPGNREPEADEKALCTPFLDRQIELVDPELLITLGLHAARHILRSPLSMTRLRGQVYPWNGRKVVATFHPAYLLRSPEKKKDCWQDIQMALKELGLAPPTRSGGAPGGPAR